MKKKPHWTAALSGPVKLRLEERVFADGYGVDADAWVADMLATALRSPQGYVLRFGKAKPAVKAEAAAEDGEDLFSTATAGGGEG
jgi:hypothetical protein